jgi:hypothetical protein
MAWGGTEFGPKMEIHLSVASVRVIIGALGLSSTFDPSKTPALADLHTPGIRILTLFASL